MALLVESSSCCRPHHVLPSSSSFGGSSFEFWRRLAALTVVTSLFGEQSGAAGIQAC